MKCNHSIFISSVIDVATLRYKDSQSQKKFDLQQLYKLIYCSIEEVCHTYLGVPIIIAFHCIMFK